MKRVGFIWEELTSIDNCEKAVLKGISNKRKTKRLKYIKDNHKEFGKRLQNILVGGWMPDGY